MNDPLMELFDCVWKRVSGPQNHLLPIRAWVWRCLQVYNKINNNWWIYSYCIMLSTCSIICYIYLAPFSASFGSFWLKKWRVNLPKRHPPKRGRFGDPMNREWHEFRVHMPRGCLHPNPRLGHLGTMEFGSLVQILKSFIHGIFGNQQKRSNICWKWFSSLWKPMDFWAPQFWNKPKMWCSQSNCASFFFKIHKAWNLGSRFLSSFPAACRTCSHTL